MEQYPQADRQHRASDASGGSATLANLMAPPPEAVQEQQGGGLNLENTGIRYGFDNRFSAGSAQEFWNAPRARLLSSSSMMSNSSVHSGMFVPSSPGNRQAQPNTRASYDMGGNKDNEFQLDPYERQYPQRSRLDSALSGGAYEAAERARSRSNNFYPERPKDEGSDRETDASGAIGAEEEEGGRKRLLSHGSLATVYDACKVVEGNDEMSTFEMEDAEKGAETKNRPDNRRRSSVGEFGSFRGSFDADQPANTNPMGFSDFGNGEVYGRQRSRTSSYGGFLEASDDSFSSGDEDDHNTRGHGSRQPKTYRSTSDADSERLQTLLAASAATQSPMSSDRRHYDTRPRTKPRSSTQELENLAEVSSSLSKMPNTPGQFKWSIPYAELPTVKTISGPGLRSGFEHQGVINDKMGFKVRIKAPRPFQQRLSACGGSGMVSSYVEQILAHARANNDSNSDSQLDYAQTDTFSLTPDRYGSNKKPTRKAKAAAPRTTSKHQTPPAKKRKAASQPPSSVSTGPKRGGARQKTARPPSNNTYTVTDDNRLVNNPPEGYLDADQVASSLAKAAVPHKLDHIMKLKRWVYDHWSHPYPSPEEKQDLLKELSGSFNSTQLKDWFRNERKRYWRPFQDSQAWEHSEHARKDAMKNAASNRSSDYGRQVRNHRSNGSDASANYRPTGSSRTSNTSKGLSTRSTAGSFPISRAHYYEDDNNFVTSIRTSTVQQRNRDGCDDPEGVLRNGTLTFSALQDVADYSLARACSEERLSLQPDERKQVQRDLFSRLVSKQRSDGATAVDELKEIALKIREVREHQRKPDFSPGIALNEARASLNKYINIQSK
eukprot:gb/GECG01000667.1/.p1 GENE.gb/GECG01000667.1/~~gb/GECG01000667.1/.p1  ORF type:complete len:834 (+),score=119.87 gb/GECG01000667.1/:1-2502(+)